MAKINGGLIELSGKMGDEVFVQSNRYGSYIRKAPKPGSKKNQAAIKQNYKRTAFLNHLASEINHIIGSESEGHKHRDFYFNLHKRFRKQPLNNRFLLLHSLVGMDIHPRYTIDRITGQDVLTTSEQKNKVLVNLRVKEHPRARFNCNCYSYELLLICWNKTSKPAQYQRQLSDWIYIKKGKPEFEFLFTKPAGTRHWMLCVKQKMGIDGKPGSLKTQGMRIVEVATLDKKEQSLLAKISMEKKKNKPASAQETILRVKPKRIDG
jgi:hypothetical protein